MAELSDQELLDTLGVGVGPETKTARSRREERIIVGFEEIQRFFEQHDRPPLHGEGRDVFERLYAVRLDRLREMEECRSLLEPLDHQELLSSVTEEGTAAPLDELDDDALLSELGVVPPTGDDVTNLKHAAAKNALIAIADPPRRSIIGCKKLSTVLGPLQQSAVTGIDDEEHMLRRNGPRNVLLDRGHRDVPEAHLRFIEIAALAF